MNTAIILENTVRFSLDESWQRNCTVLSDAPLSAAHWKMDEMTGEQYLLELPELLLFPEQMGKSSN